MIYTSIMLSLMAFFAMFCTLFNNFENSYRYFCSKELPKRHDNYNNFIEVSNVFSTFVLMEDNVNNQTNIANRTQIIKNPN